MPLPKGPEAISPLDPLIIYDITRREEEKRRDRRRPHAPSPNAPGGMPEWDPAEEERWRRNEKEKKKEPNSDGNPTVISF